MCTWIVSHCPCTRASQFVEYVHYTNLVFYTEYQPTSPRCLNQVSDRLAGPRIHLVLNGGGELDAWNWENCPEHWLKRGMVGLTTTTATTTTRSATDTSSTLRGRRRSCTWSRTGTTWPGTRSG